MAKAKNVHAGDWIKVDGKKVRVTTAETREGRRRIGYKGRTKSGVLDRDPDASLDTVYRMGWKW